MESLQQGATMAQCLARGGVGVAIAPLELEQAVSGSDNVLDFRTRLRLQQWQRVDQHALVGNELRRLLELGQRRPRRDAALQYRARFYIDGGRQVRERVVGLIGPPD